MCEVGKCCLCISLYHGCLISSVVTIAVSIFQTTIFSMILFTSYHSKYYTSGDDADDKGISFPNDTLPSFENETDYEPTYFFPTTLCPFGFQPLLLSKPTVKGGVGATGKKNDTLSEGKTFANISAEPPRSVKCVAPGQGMLTCMVVASVVYGIVGGILFIGVRRGVSQMLSIWFFYTVGYNILALVVGLLDGVYTGAGDISSYVTCCITVYCIVVVDSYYEKALIGTREGAGGSSGQNSFNQQPSLVVVKSSPQSDLDFNGASGVKLLNHHNGHPAGIGGADDLAEDAGITEPFLGP